METAHLVTATIRGLQKPMSEHTGSVAVQDRETDHPSAARPKGPDVVPSPEKSAEQKCPYLAGRPPHGSYHLWPSGVNVCYARGADGRAYGHASKETQQDHCFGGTGVYERCESFQRAHAGSIPLPMFDGAGPSTARGGPAAPTRHAERRRVKRRRRRSRLREWRESGAFSTCVCACWILLALVAFWLVLRTM